jgi:hypothetical protein
MNIKEMLNSDIKTLVEKYHSEKVLNTFLIHVLEDSKKYYSHKENPKVLEVQNRVIELLGDLLLGKKVRKGELKSATNAASNAAANAAYYATNAVSAANAAYAAASAAANAAYYATNAVSAANAAYAAASAASNAAFNAAANGKDKNW